MFAGNLPVRAKGDIASLNISFGTDAYDGTPLKPQFERTPRKKIEFEDSRIISTDDFRPNYEPKPVIIPEGYTVKFKANGKQKMADSGSIDGVMKTIPPGDLQNITRLVISNEFGSVELVSEPTDFSEGMDFTVVTIISNSVEVYEDGESPTPDPTNLNRQCIITLKKMFPKKKTPQGFERYETMLKKSCAQNKNGSTFVSYNNTDGTFQFQVQHFTKYDFGQAAADDDDDDDEMDQEIQYAVGDQVIYSTNGAQKRGTVMSCQQAKGTYQVRLDTGEQVDTTYVTLTPPTDGPDDVEGHSSAAEAEDTDDADDLDTSADQSGTLPASDFLNSPLALDVVDDVAALPSAPGTGMLMATTAATAAEQSFREQPSMLASHRGFPHRSFLAERSFMNDTRRSTRQAAPVHNRVELGPVTRGEDVEVVQSLYDRQSDKSLPPRGAAGLMGRSFRVGWGPNGRLVLPMKPSSKTPASKSKIRIAHVRATASSDKDLQSKLMTVQLNKSTGGPVVADVMCCPRIVSFAFQRRGNQFLDAKQLREDEHLRSNDLLQAELSRIMFDTDESSTDEIEFEIGDQPFGVRIGGAQESTLTWTPQKGDPQVVYKIHEVGAVPRSAVVDLMKDLAAVLEACVKDSMNIHSRMHNRTVARQARKVLNNVAIFKLFDALWGFPGEHDWEHDWENGGTDEELKMRTEMMRRRALSTWLGEICAEESSFQGSEEAPERVNAAVAVDTSEKSYLAGIFKCLTLNKVTEAAKIAIQHKDYRLAMLIGSPRGRQGTRDEEGMAELMREQLKAWEAQSVDKFFPDVRLRIYVLLSGQSRFGGTDFGGSDHFASNRDSYLCVCKGLDWKRAFALYLWYIDEDADEDERGATEIKSAVQRYYDAAQARGNDNKEVPPPYPLYKEDMLDTSPALIENGGNNRTVEGRMAEDTCYHLLKIWTNQGAKANVNDDLRRTALCPTTHTECPIDFHISWHLAIALEGPLTPNEDVLHTTQLMDQLHMDYAAQLEGLGLWQWATYVLLHLSDERQRTQAVRELLCRNCTAEPTEDEGQHVEFVTGDLQIPHSWIWEARALHAEYQGNALLQVEYLNQAEQFHAAHKVVTDSLASEIITRNNVNAKNSRRQRKTTGDSDIGRLKEVLATLEEAKTNGIAG